MKGGAGWTAKAAALLALPVMAGAGVMLGGRLTGDLLRAGGTAGAAGAGNAVKAATAGGTADRSGSADHPRTGRAGRAGRAAPPAAGERTRQPCCRVPRTGIAPEGARAPDESGGSGKGTADPAGLPPIKAGTSGRDLVEALLAGAGKQPAAPIPPPEGARRILAMGGGYVFYRLEAEGPAGTVRAAAEHYRRALSAGGWQTVLDRATGADRRDGGERLIVAEREGRTLHLFIHRRAGVVRIVLRLQPVR